MDKREASPVNWEGAPRGLIKNAPHDDLPDGSVAGLINAHSFPTEWQPRLGTEIFSEVLPPVIRSGIRAYKTGNRIIALTGSFSEADVSRYFVWSDEDEHDEIQVYISDTEVQTDTTGDKDPMWGCWIHGRLNMWGFHKTSHKHAMLWESEVYVYDELMTSKTKAICVSRESPTNAVSTWDEQDEYGVIFNSNGIYLLDFTGTGDWPLIFKRNTNVPSVVIEDEARNDYKRIRYDYIYAMARIGGKGIRDRTIAGSKIVQQSGSTALQEIGSDREKDWGTIWREKKIDNGTKTCGRLYGAVVNTDYQTPTWWNAVAAPGVSMRVTINGRTENFVVDMGPAGYNVSSMVEVANAWQETLRLIYYKATCVWRDRRFVVTSGEEDGSTIGYCEAGIGGTNVAAIMRLTNAYAELDNAFVYATPLPVNVLTMPYATNSTTNRARHWTHYVVLRTENIGPDGVNPRIIENTQEELPPINFTWVADARVAGAFYAYKEHSGLVTALSGEFEQADVGTPIKWEDGDVETISEYVDSTHVYTTSGYYGYYEDKKPLQAAAIGGGVVVLGHQTGDRVYRDGGTAFSEDDVGETLFFSDGYEVVIIEYVSEDCVVVSDSVDRDMQGMTHSPVSRVFNDTVSDDKLFARQGEAHVGLWEHRFWKNMKSGACGTIVPGFMISASRNSSILYYCQLPIGRKYMGGYHLVSRQLNDRIEDSIQYITKLPNRVIVFCKNSTWGGPTNLSDSNIKALPEFGYSYAVLYIDVLDARIGLNDYGSLAPVDNAMLIMRCTDGSVRQFDGTQFGEDVTIDPDSRQDRIKATLGETYPLSASVYSDKEGLGYVLWLRQKT